MMQLNSKSFETDGKIPDKYRYDEGNNPSSTSGRNISPAFSIEDIPKETESLALVMKDIDNPDQVFVHWLLWNIDPEQIQIRENETPKNSIVGMNSFQTSEYQGPNPDQRQNTILTEIYALKEKINLPSGSTYDQFKDTVKGKVIETAEIKGYCRRTGTFALE